MKAMKKIGVVAAGAAGFVLGSRSGRKPYESLERTARRFAKRPGVPEAKVSAAVDTASEKAHAATSSLEEKFASTGFDSGDESAE